MEIEIGFNQASPSRLTVLGELVQILARTRKRARILEIGSYEGQSALALSAALVNYMEEGGQVLCVDPWEPYAETVGTGEAYSIIDADMRAGHVYRRFLKNTSQADPRGPVSSFCGTLELAIAAGFAVGPFDLVYIDGNHTYRYVKDDILRSQDLVVVGGIICGDDLEEQLESTKPGEALANCNVDYVNGYHPGVTLAVGLIFGTVWAKEGVWAMRRTPQGWTAEIEKEET